MQLNFGQINLRHPAALGVVGLALLMLFAPNPMERAHKRWAENQKAESLIGKIETVNKKRAGFFGDRGPAMNRVKKKRPGATEDDETPDSSQKPLTTDEILKQRVAEDRRRSYGPPPPHPFRLLLNR